MYDAGTYQRARADGMRAQSALRLARWIAADRLAIEPYGEPLTIERDGFDVSIRVRPDEYVDLGDLGYGTFVRGREDYRTGYTHPEDPAAIPNPYADSRGISDAPFYLPAIPLSDRVAEYRKAGASKSVALDNARADQQAELKAVAYEYGPAVYVLDVTASRGGIDLGSASVHGIEIGWSDITRTDGSEYFAEVAEDLIPEAIAEAQDALARLAVPA